MTDEERMTDLVQRLRDEGLGFGIGPALLCYQAAEEIERLRKEAMSDYHEGWEEGYAALEAENERLREAFSNLKSIFRVNMLRAFPETSHEVIDGYIANALGETDA